MLEGIAHYAEKAWRYWLSRRSSKSGIGWEQFQKLLRIYPLPIPRIVHNICWSLQGSTVMRQSGTETLVTEEPYALIAHVRVCGGAGWVTTGSTRKPTAYRLRSFLAAAFGGGSPRAFGCKFHRSEEEVCPG